jgi:hypothetical protein
MRIATSFIQKTLLWTALPAVLSLSVPGVAGAQQSEPGYGPVPSYGTPVRPQDQIKGTVTGFDGAYIVHMRDDRGYDDHVSMHQGTEINPLGTRLVEGMPVTIYGYANGPTFEANRIDVAVAYAPNGGYGGYGDSGGYGGYGGNYYAGGGYPYYGSGYYGGAYPWGIGVGIGLGLGFGWGWGCCGYWGGWGWGYRGPWGYYRGPYGYYRGTAYGNRGYYGGYRGGYYGGGYRGGYYGGGYRGGYYGGGYRGGYYGGSRGGYYGGGNRGTVHGSTGGGHPSGGGGHGGGRPR